MGSAAEAAPVAAFRFWRRVMLGGWLLVLPLVAAGGALWAPLALAAVPAAVAFGVGARQVSTFLCPRCRRPFTWRLGRQTVFASECVRCGHSIRVPRAAPPASCSGRGPAARQPNQALHLTPPSCPVCTAHPFVVQVAGVTAVQVSWVVRPREGVCDDYA